MTGHPIKTDRSPPSLRDAVQYFLVLGTTGFGGPVVLCDLMERDLVEKRGWLDKEQMRDVIAVCQTLPGPLAVQVAIFIGYMRFGWWGAWASGWALILPASVMVFLLAAAYVHLHDLPWLSAVIYGVNPTIIVLILSSWWRLVRLGIGDWFQAIVATLCAAATLGFPNRLTTIFLVSGLFGITWYRRRGDGPTNGARLRELGSFVLLAKMAWFFLMTGALTFGGGLAIVPLLQQGLVDDGHWLSAQDFLTAVAVGMVTPGPVMTAATFAGYVVAGPVGAVVCTIAIYLPSFLLILTAAPLLVRHRENPVLQGFVKGVYAAAMGAILGGTIVLATHAIKDGVTALIAALGLVALLWFKVSGLSLVAVTAAIGLAVIQLTTTQ